MEHHDDRKIKIQGLNILCEELKENKVYCFLNSLRYHIRFIILFGRMESIISMYKTVQGNLPTSDLNYQTHKSYLDPIQLKREREKKASKYVKDKPKKSLDLTIKKGTFIESLEKRESSLPSPHTYKPKGYSPSYKDRKYENLPSRSTIFADLVKKLKSPGPSDYVSKMKSKSIGSFDKAPNNSIWDGEIEKSSKLPGIGQYNAHRQKYDSTLGLWNKETRDLDKKPKYIIPSSSQYVPHPPDKKLFSEISRLTKKQSMFNKEKRFRTDK